jgi:predicted nucleic acid-binding protein
MIYVLDTSAWYAFVFETEEAHQIADQCMSEKPELIVPYPVLEELTALAHHRINKNSVIDRIYYPFYTSPFITIQYLDSEDDKNIWKLYQSLPNKIDYMDACIFYYSKKFKLPIFTFDNHFKELSPKPHLVPR